MIATAGLCACVNVHKSVLRLALSVVDVVTVPAEVSNYVG